MHAEEDEQKDNHPLVSILKHGISCKTTTTQLDQPHESGHRTTSTRSQDLDKISILTKPFFTLLLPQSLSPFSSLPSLSLSLSHTHKKEKRINGAQPQNYKKKTQSLRNPQTEPNKQEYISMTKPFSFFHSYPNNSLPQYNNKKEKKDGTHNNKKEKKNDTHKKNNKSKEKKKKNGTYKKKKSNNNNNKPLIEDFPKQANKKKSNDKEKNGTHKKKKKSNNKEKNGTHNNNNNNNNKRASFKVSTITT